MFSLHPRELVNRVGVGPPELFGARPLILSELRKYLQSSPPTRPAGDLNRMVSEWDQLQSDASIAMGLYIFIICAYSYSPYLIIVADAADAVSVNFSGQCKFLQI